MSEPISPSGFDDQSDFDDVEDGSRPNSDIESDSPASNRNVQTDCQPQETSHKDFQDETRIDATLTIPGFETIKKLGSGAFADVFQVRHRDSDEFRAAKRLHSKSETAIRRLKEEFENQHRASNPKERHPNIAVMFDRVQASDGTQCLIREYIEGEKFKDINFSNLSVPERVTLILIPLFKMLSHLENKGIIARDLSYNNFFLRQNNTPVLTELGHSRDSNESQSNNLTRDGSVIGTRAFMSPEQHENSKVVSFPSAVYSLGILSYFVLTNELPFDSQDDDTALRNKKLSMSFTSLKVRTSDQIPHDLSDIIGSTLNAQPHKRPKSQLIVEHLEKFDSENHRLKPLREPSKFAKLRARCLEGVRRVVASRKGFKVLISFVVLLTITLIVAFGSTFWFHGKFSSELGNHNDTRNELLNLRKKQTNEQITRIDQILFENEKILAENPRALNRRIRELELSLDQLRGETINLETAELEQIRQWGQVFWKQAKNFSNPNGANAGLPDLALKYLSESERCFKYLKQFAQDERQWKRDMAMVMSLRGSIKLRQPDGVDLSKVDIFQAYDLREAARDEADPNSLLEFAVSCDLLAEWYVNQTGTDGKALTKAIGHVEEGLAARNRAFKLAKENPKLELMEAPESAIKISEGKLANLKFQLGDPLGQTEHDAKRITDDRLKRIGNDSENPKELRSQILALQRNGRLAKDVHERKQFCSDAMKLAERLHDLETLNGTVEPENKEAIPLLINCYVFFANSCIESKNIDAQSLEEASAACMKGKSLIPKLGEISESPFLKMVVGIWEMSADVNRRLGRFKDALDDTKLAMPHLRTINEKSKDVRDIAMLSNLLAIQSNIEWNLGNQSNAISRAKEAVQLLEVLPEEQIENPNVTQSLLKARIALKDAQELVPEANNPSR